jgi:hypothetical protein
MKVSQGKKARNKLTPQSPMPVVWSLPNFWKLYECSQTRIRYTKWKDVLKEREKLGFGAGYITEYKVTRDGKAEIIGKTWVL